MNKRFKKSVKKIKKLYRHSHRYYRRLTLFVFFNALALPFLDVVLRFFTESLEALFVFFTVVGGGRSLSLFDEFSPDSDDFISISPLWMLWSSFSFSSKDILFPIIFTIFL